MRTIPGTTHGLRRYQARVLLGLLRAISSGPGDRPAAQTVMFPRQAGKNEVAAMLVAALLLQHARAGGSIIVCAPTFEPQAIISRQRSTLALGQIAHLIPDDVPHGDTGNVIRVGRAEAVFLSASPEANVAGHTASILLIGDEAQDIDAAWFDRQFRPMAASTGAPIILFGTAWDGRSLLEREAARTRAFDGRQAGRPYRDFLPRHHQVSWREVAASRPVYGRHVLLERERLGANHPIFLSQYELTPARAAGGLLSETQLEALGGQHPVLAGPRAGERYVAGLDFGGEGANADATVLTIARVADDGRAEVVAFRTWRGEPFATVLAGIANEAAAWRFERLAADATGMGAPLCAQLLPALGARLERVVFTAATKSAMGFDLLAATNTARLALPADDGSAAFVNCLAELRACRSSLAEGRQLRWFAPTGQHDDHVASLALCLHAAAGIRPPRIARGRNRA